MTTWLRPQTGEDIFVVSLGQTALATVYRALLVERRATDAEAEALAHAGCPADDPRRLALAIRSDFLTGLCDTFDPALIRSSHLAAGTGPLALRRHHDHHTP